MSSHLKPGHHLKNARGNVIAALVVSLIAMGSLASILGSIVSQTSSATYNIVENSIATVRYRIRSLILDEVAWRESRSDVSNASTIDCISNPSPSASCRVDSSSFTPTTLRLRDATGAVVYDSAIATNGFSMNGDPCNSFNAVTGDDTCPIRVDFATANRCEAGDSATFPACTQVSLDIQVNFQYRPANLQRLVLNAASRSFVVNRRPATELSPDWCTRIGGPLGYETTGVCRLSYADFSCPAGQVIYRIVLGVPECRTP